MSIEAMKLALEALDAITDDVDGTGLNTKPSFDLSLEAITALRQAIEQAEQAQPVACPYCHNSHTLGAVYFDQNCAGCVKRMTSPPPRQPLTDEQIWKDDGIMAANSGYGATFETLRELVKAIEAAHGIKE